MVFSKVLALWDAVWYDLRHSVRALRRSPFVAMMVGVTLALGIGANSTMFALLDQLFLAAPPHVVEAQRIVQFSIKRRNENQVQVLQPYVLRSVLSHGVRGFASVAAAEPPAIAEHMYFSVGRGASASHAAGELVSANYFALLGVRATVGRVFQLEEDLDHADVGSASEAVDKEAVLGYGYWQRQFGGRQDAIGKLIDVGSDSYTIVGVAPAGFTGTGLREVDVWVPIEAASSMRVGGPEWATSPRSPWLVILARLRSGVSAKLAAAQATIVYRNWARSTFSGSSAGRLAGIDSEDVVLGSIVPGRSPLTQGAGFAQGLRIAELLGAMVLVVLLIACANVASLLLLRGLDRQREMAVRLSLGVSRLRLSSQLVLEGLLLAVLGGCGALLVTELSVPFIRRWLIGQGGFSGFALNERVLVFTGLVAVGIGFVTSLFPARQVFRRDLIGHLRSGSPRNLASGFSLGSSLVVGQAALTVLLLTGAGVFIRSLDNALSVNVGIGVDRVLVARLDRMDMGMPPAAAGDLFSRFAQRARSLPGITGSAVSLALPFASGWGVMVKVPGVQPPDLDLAPLQYPVTDEYFSVLGTDVLEGRGFAPYDRAGGMPVAIVNETMARTYWSGVDPVGKCVMIGDKPTSCTVVVGVVSDTHRSQLVEEAGPQLYRPLRQLSPTEVDRAARFLGYTLVVRTAGRTAALVEPLRRALQGIDPTAPYVNVSTMRDLLAPQTRSWTLGARVFSVLGALALALATVGLYGVVAFAVRRRMHEFAVRAALGAQPLGLLRVSLVQGIRPAVVGLTIGIALALLAGRLANGLLFRESPHDPVVLAVGALVLLCCAGAASLEPAWRAAAVEPTEALRTE